MRWWNLNKVTKAWSDGRYVLHYDTVEPYYWSVIDLKKKVFSDWTIYTAPLPVSKKEAKKLCIKEYLNLKSNGKIRKTI
jgi:hypothetical protein